MKLSRFLFVLSLGVAACKTPPLPPLPASHPASKDAPPGVAHHYFSGLREDEAMRVTKRLLSETDSAETKTAPMKTSEMPRKHSDMTMPMEHH